MTLFGTILSPKKGISGVTQKRARSHSAPCIWGYLRTVILPCFKGISYDVILGLLGRYGHGENGHTCFREAEMMYAQISLMTSYSPNEDQYSLFLFLEKPNSLFEWNLSGVRGLPLTPFWAPLETWYIRESGHLGPLGRGISMYMGYMHTYPIPPSPYV
jgi:hypothetical protein